MRTNKLIMLASLLGMLAAACSNDAAKAENPFLKSFDKAGKEDTAYLNPDGIEVEVDLEADIEGPEDSLLYGPPELAQYALTVLRTNGEFFLESLAEDATSPARVEWQINNEWIPARQVAQMTKPALKRFRLRGVNAVLLSTASKGAEEGKVFTAKVPVNPFNTFELYGETCADKNPHLGLDQSMYWYQWQPQKEKCQAKMQDMTITISKILPPNKTVYPEYDKLIADKKITAVLMFGQIGDEMKDDDEGFYWTKTISNNLREAGYKEVKVTENPVGKRFAKTIKDITLEVDIYSPREFAGLSDMEHFANFQKAISEHEIVAYSGHSMLGASDFWSKPTYPANYQILLYGGCLGYQYYVRPIIEGKKGWDNLDLMSSVVEVPTVYNDWTSLVLAQIAYAVEHQYRVSWQNILGEIREYYGVSTFGVSGVRENTYQP